MRTIASLLFGHEAGELLDRITGGDGITGDGITGDGITGDGGGDRQAAERVLRSGEWCGSTPGRGSAGRVGRAARGQRRGIGIGDGWI
jgi:hypothetical protein